MTLKTLRPVSDGTYKQMKIYGGGGLFQNLSVNAFDAAKDQWEKVGSSPYLDAQDQPTNIVKNNQYSPAYSIYLPVDGIATSNNWSRTGASPYLDAQDDPTNIIYTDVKDALSDEFTFQDPSSGDQANPLVFCHLRIWAKQDQGGNDKVEVWVYDGSSWQLTVTPSPNPGSYGWIEVDLTSILDTWAKVVNAQFRLVHKRVAGADVVTVDYAELWCKYESAPKCGDFDFENSGLSNPIVGVKLQVYSKRDTTNGYVRVWLKKGAGWDSYDILSDTSYSWKEVNIGLWTWAQLNAAKMYLEYKGTATPYPYVYVDCVRLNVEYQPSTHYDKVDDVTPDDDTTYIATLDDAGTVVSDSFNHESSGLTSETINYVRVYNRVHCPAGLGGTRGRIRTLLRTHSTDYVGVPLYPDSWTDYYTEYTQNPYTSAAWTVSEVDSLEAGSQGYSQYDSGSLAWMQGKCTQEYVSLDYSAGVTAKGFSDLGGGSDAFVNPYRAMGFSETGGGSDAFGIPFKAMAFSDVGQGNDVFAIVWKALEFSDVGSGADVFKLLRELDFSDVGQGSDVFAVVLKALGFSDTGQGTDVFTNPYRAMGFADSGSGSDVFSIVLKVLGFSDVGSGADLFGKEILGAVAKAFSDSGSGTDSFAKAITLLSKGFSDSGAGSDVFKIVFKALKFDDVASGLDVFTNPFRAMEFTDVGSGLDMFTLLRELDFSDVGSALDVFTKAALGLTEKFFYEVGSGLTVFDAFKLQPRPSPFRARSFPVKGHAEASFPVGVSKSSCKPGKAKAAGLGGLKSQFKTGQAKAVIST